MHIVRESITQVLVWVVLVTVFVSCQSDPVDSVVAPIPVAQDSNTRNEPVGDTPGQVQPGRLGDSPQGLIGELLGLVSRLLFPLTGGTLDLPALDTHLAIPRFPGLLPRWFSLSILERTPAGLTEPLSREYYLQPHGLEFYDNAPASMKVSFSAAGLGSRNPSLYRCYWDSLGTWVVQPTVVDIPNQRFIVVLHHFSRYAFGR